MRSKLYHTFQLFSTLSRSMQWIIITLSVTVCWQVIFGEGAVQPKYKLKGAGRAKPKTPVVPTSQNWKSMREWRAGAAVPCSGNSKWVISQYLQQSPVPPSQHIHQSVPTYLEDIREKQTLGYYCWQNTMSSVLYNKIIIREHKQEMVLMMLQFWKSSFDTNTHFHILSIE